MTSLPTSVADCGVGRKRSETDTADYMDCVSCDVTKGQYQDEVGQEHCKQVPPGKYIVGMFYVSDPL